jgi:hypothetical protein
MSDSATWIATLSDGSTIAESDIKIVPGERMPWVKLTNHLGQSGLHLTSLRLNYKGRTIHLPRMNFDRFAYNTVSRAPLFYSLCYHVEGDIPIDTGIMKQTNFVELSAHYDDFVVSYIQDVSEGANSWIVVTDDRTGLAETPRRK